MPEFDKSSIAELKNYLYCGSIHDGEISQFNYDRENQTLNLDIINNYVNKRICFTFYDVLTFVSTSGEYDYASRNTIYGLVLEEDFSLFKSFPMIKLERFENMIYFVFETFSGDEIHIVFKKVSIIKECKTGDG